MSLHGAHIFTSKGLHECGATIHDDLAKHHASQCGFCTPGMAVACHAAAATVALRREACKEAAAADGPLDEQRVMRQALDGNLCRCTGYRPLIEVADGFKLEVADIEDLVSSGGLHLGAPTRRCRVVKTADGADWFLPCSLHELLEVYDGSQHLLAGNTSVGLPGRSWARGQVISLNGVDELRRFDWRDDSIEVGALTTIQDCIEELLTAKRTRLASVWELGYQDLVDHLNGIAGRHVRGAATVAGNIMLARSGLFESDIATILLALDAKVTLVVPKAPHKRTGMLSAHATHERSSLSMEAFLRAGEQVSAAAVITSIRVPLLTRHSTFFSKKVAVRAANAHAHLNMSCCLRFDKDGAESTVSKAHVAAGFYCAPSLRDASSGLSGTLPWRNMLLAETNAALQDASLGDKLAQALERVEVDMAAAHPDWIAYYRSAAPSILMRWLGPLAGVPHSKERLTLDVEFSSSRSFPAPDPDRAPLGEPLRKLGVMQQATGEAVYSGDAPRAQGCLYAALVLAPHPCGAFTLDAHDASHVPGFHSVITAADVPADPFLQPGYPLFASHAVDWANQPVAVVVAASHAAALRAASLVVTCPLELTDADIAAMIAIGGAQGSPSHAEAHTPAMAQRLMDVSSCTDGGAAAASPPPPALTQPELQPAEQPSPEETALEVGEDGPPRRHPKLRFDVGDAADVFACARDGVDVIHGQWETRPLSHMYMEPQTAVASCDEDGMMHVTSSTQNVDATAQAVSTVLGLPLNKVVVECRRAGGGFGGKSSLSALPAAAAAVAARVTSRQVRLLVDRRVDLATTGGRPPIKATYRAAYEAATGRILAVEAHLDMTFGFVPEYMPLQAKAMVCALFPVYDVQNVSITADWLDGRPLLPFTAMRGPGAVENAFLSEHVLYHVAASCGLDPAAVRATNFKKLGKVPDPWGAPGAVIDGVCNTTLQYDTGEPFTFSVPKAQYTLPAIWAQLHDRADVERRRAEVAAFNEAHACLARGIAVVPTSYTMYQQYNAAMVHLRVDGSVSLVAPGAEIGQNLATKCAQAAAFELSTLLPPGEGRRRLAAHLLTVIRLQDNNTNTLPNIGDTGGSTTSEGCCRSIAQACQKLIRRLEPFVKDGSDEVTTWQDAIAAASASVALSALGGFADVPAAGGCDARVVYQTYGAAVVEAEVDCLTGERRVVRADLLYDCGAPLNSAADIGQAEGAFVMGLGQVLSEEMVLAASGQVLSNSTWNYKIPTSLDVPATFNVSLLENSANFAGTSWASSKAVGEPPLLLATGALEAVRLAVEAVHRRRGASSGTDLGKAATAPPPSVTLFPPLTPWNIQAACAGSATAECPS